MKDANRELNQTEVVEEAMEDHEQRMRVLKLQDEFNETQHQRKMKEFEYLRENDRLHHEREMERLRVKSAEINKTLNRKQMTRY